MAGVFVDCAKATTSKGGEAGEKRSKRCRFALRSDMWPVNYGRGEAGEDGKARGRAAGVQRQEGGLVVAGASVSRAVSAAEGVRSTRWCAFEKDSRARGMRVFRAGVRVVGVRVGAVVCDGGDGETVLEASVTAQAQGSIDTCHVPADLGPRRATHLRPRLTPRRRGPSSTPEPLSHGNCTRRSSMPAPLAIGRYG